MKRFKKILVLVDGEAPDPAGLDKAVWLARANSAHLTLLDVTPRERGALATLFDSVSDEDGETVDASALEDALLQARRDMLEAMASRCRSAGLETAVTTRAGPVFLSAIRQVLEEDHDLVLKTASSHGGQFFLSDDLHLMRKCPCPVWIVQGGIDPSVRVVLAAVDPDPHDPIRSSLAHTVLTLGTSMAERTGAVLHVLNAWLLHEEAALRSSRLKLSTREVDALVESERRKSETRLTALLRDIPDTTGRRVVAHRKGWAGDVAPAYAEEIGADTMVMGTVARTGVSGFFIGNSAETILNRVRCSVMTVKPPGFVSPVNLDDGRSDA